MKYIYLKNIIDFLLAILIFIIFLPLLIVISFLVYLNLGKPIFFIQERPGYKGKIFKLIKFRTMKNIYDLNNALVSDENRQSKLGNWLRKTSLDEIPELINIILGQMSFVGPRPLLCEYLNLYSPKQFSRHNVKPGITGFAQINGRNRITWDEKLSYDFYYTKNISFWLDIKILFKTIIVIFSQNGINHKDHVTMPRFKGNK